VTAPTPAQLALLRSSFPARRVAPALASSGKPTFSALLQTATQRAPAAVPLPRVSPLLAKKTVAAPDPQLFTAPGAGPAPVSRSEILHNAEQLMGVPYVWGGTSPSSLDCSAFVSRAWGVSRQTTDTLASVARPISKDELQAGDALNLTTGRDPEGDGHVRLFDRWANPEHTQLWVYEETPPRSVHHVINWDPAYQPMRRLNVTDA
jgi:cell wall-associated NlpC family hydrolase